MKPPPAGWSPAALIELLTVKKNNVNAHSMGMNEWKNIIMLFKTPIHVLVCNVGHKHMFCYLDFRCYFEANGQNHIHFRLIQVLKNSMAWNFLTFTSPSSKLEFVYPPCCGVEEQIPWNTHLLVRFNTWTSQRPLNWNPIPNLTIVLIWKTPACLKFGKTSNGAVENLLQRKLWVWAANDAILFQLFVAQCTLVKCNALW